MGYVAERREVIGRRVIISAGTLGTNEILLRSRDVIRNSSAGKLEFGEVLMLVAADAQFVLSEQIRHSILQVTHA